MSTPEVIPHADKDLLAAATAARLIATISAAQAASGTASVVLTGGGVGIAVLRQLRDSPARDAIDFGRLDVYWGDERFVPAGDPERNATQAREALLDHVPVDPTRVFAMPASDGEHGADPDAAARGYARTLADNATGGAPSPVFDVTLLGMGEEGHTASLFPGTDAARERERSVVAVHDSPKPPPRRISCTIPTIERSAEVWLVAAGAAKATAVSLALAGADPADLPVAGARGARRTLWLLDEAAAGRIR